MQKIDVKLSVVVTLEIPDCVELPSYPDCQACLEKWAASAIRGPFELKAGNLIGQWVKIRSEIE